MSGLTALHRQRWVVLFIYLFIYDRSEGKRSSGDKNQYNVFSKK